LEFNLQFADPVLIPDPDANPDPDQQIKFLSEGEAYHVHGTPHID
jgi:hypothetical protein